MESIRGKMAIGIHLSGGKDTRAILAILLGQGVPVKVAIFIENEKEKIQNDLKISNQICQDYKIKTTKIKGDYDFYSLSRLGNHGFDIILSGFLMTEILDRGYVGKGELIVDYVTKTKELLEEIDGLWVPMSDMRCLAASMYITTYKKINGIVNKKVIEWNYPELSK